MKSQIRLGGTVPVRTKQHMLLFGLPTLYNFSRLLDLHQGLNTKLMVTVFSGVLKIVTVYEVSLDVNGAFGLHYLHKVGDDELNHLETHHKETQHRPHRKVTFKSIEGVQYWLLHHKVVDLFCSFRNIPP